MPASLDLSALRFAAPAMLPLLAAPALLFLVWMWQAWRRHGDITQMRRHRQLPTRHSTERLPVLGDLAFWFCLIAALASVIVALARPVAVASMVRTSGIDLVILQDGSASMRVRDVRGDRWRRSMAFLRTIGESLQWEDDRVAMALFATIAAPQIRLTRDPNTFFFFLDHLEDQPPFRIEDDTTWDTNIERGIYWGLRLIDKDAEMQKGTGGVAAAGLKPSPSTDGSRARLQPSQPPLQPGQSGLQPGQSLPRKPRAFVLISDGQAWSGQVAKSIELAQERRIPLFVVGVGTTVGGVIPDPNRDPTRAAITSALDRTSLAVIATAGGGRYFELDRETDREIANAVIDTTRRRAESGTVDESARDLYWSALLAAAAFLGLGVLFLRDRASLALQLGAAVVVLVVLARIS
jgi:VWA domain-containing protein